MSKKRCSKLCGGDYLAQKHQRKINAGGKERELKPNTLLGQKVGVLEQSGHSQKEDLPMGGRGRVSYLGDHPEKVQTKKIYVTEKASPYAVGANNEKKKEAGNHTLKSWSCPRSTIFPV